MKELECCCPNCKHWFTKELTNIYSDRQDDDGSFIVVGSEPRAKQYCRDCKTFFDLIE